MVKSHSVLDRYTAYSARVICPDISEHDGMLARGEPGANEHYFAVGRSAIEVIVAAMIAAEKAEIATVLDLPCGGGRVTRHLKAFFTEAQLFVGDLDRACESFVVEKFDARVAVAPVDFVGVSASKFDLIFVGSLVTHFNAIMFERALRWFVSALAPDGLLVLTTHGRQHAHIQRTVLHHVSGTKWDRVEAEMIKTGFGYCDYDDKNPGYGLSLSSPSWILRLAEQDPTTRIILFQEAGWSKHQDVLVLQKKSIA